MRKHLVIAAMATLGLSAGSVQAVDTGVGGLVAGICEIANLEADLGSFANLSNGQSVEDLSVLVRCNSEAGATISMASLGGGLSSSTSSEVVPYSAVFETFDASGGYVSIDTVNNPADSATIAGNSGLAASGENWELTVSLDGGANYSGSYTDTIRIEISAN